MRWEHFQRVQRFRRDIISTGLALSAEGPNTAGGVSNSFYTAGEPLLEALAGSTTNEAFLNLILWHLQLRSPSLTCLLRRNTTSMCAVFNDALDSL